MSMNDRRIKCPLDALLENHKNLLIDYSTGDRKNFRRHIISVVENIFGLLASLYGYDPWEHYLTKPSPDLTSDLRKILQAIKSLKEYQQTYETPQERKDDGFRYGDGPRYGARWRTLSRSRASQSNEARGPLGFH